MAKDGKKETETGRALVSAADSQIMPSNFKELNEFAALISKTDMVPKDFREKPGNCLVAMMMGHELGLPYLQALQNIAVINGRPSIWGDLALAIVQNKGILESFKERDPSEALKLQEGRCTILRKGSKEPYTVNFTVQDAKTAGLWGKQGPWTTAPGRMLQMRARAFALRDTCSDILKGLSIAEEAQDFVVEKEIAPGVDLVTKAKDAIGPKPSDAPANDNQVREGEVVDTKVPADKEIKSHYTVEKVTKSSVNKSLFYITIQGNKHATTDEKLAEQAFAFFKEKTPIDYEPVVKDDVLYVTKVWALEPVAA